MLYFFILASAILIYNPAFAEKSTSGIVESKDGEVVQAAIVAHEVAISVAEKAMQNSPTEEVRQIAQMIIRDHEAALANFEEMAEELDDEPTESEWSEQLQAEAADRKETLSEKLGAEFDEAYLRTELEYHQDLVNLFHNELAAATDERDLNALVVNYVSELNAHIVQIENIIEAVLEDED